MGARIRQGMHARESLLAGMDLLVRAIRPTLGPTGVNVAVDGRRMGGTKRYGPPQVISQAQTIVRDFQLHDRFQDMGAAILKQAAQRTDALVGDGTATTIVLAHAMIRAGLKAIAAGANAMMVKRGMEAATKGALEVLSKMAKPMTTTEDVAQVVASAAHNSDIAETILWAFDQVGADGLITVERCPTTLGIMVECTHGFTYDRGYLSPYFVTDPLEDAVALEQPYVLLVDGGIERAEELVPLVAGLGQRDARGLLVVAPEVTGSALALLVANCREGRLPCVAVRPPSYGEVRQDMLEDLSIYTGATILCDSRGHGLRDASLGDLGRAEEVYVTARDTTVVAGGGDQCGIQGRIKMLRERMLNANDAYDLDKLQRRVAQLGGGLARLQVGGATEAEMDNRLELVENALMSMRATVAEGLVPGAGSALVAAAEAIEALDLTGDEAMGAVVVRRALEAPLRQIAENTGRSGSVVLAEVRALQQAAGACMGYDARLGRCGNLLMLGILDPCKTVRTALRSAASCASMVLTTDALVLTTAPPLSPETREGARRHLEMMSGNL